MSLHDQHFIHLAYTQDQHFAYIEISYEKECIVQWYILMGGLMYPYPI